MGPKLNSDLISINAFLNVYSDSNDSIERKEIVLQKEKRIDR